MIWVLFFFVFFWLATCPIQSKCATPATYGKTPKCKEPQLWRFVFRCEWRRSWLPHWVLFFATNTLCYLLSALSTLESIEWINTDQIWGCGCNVMSSSSGWQFVDYRSDEDDDLFGTSCGSYGSWRDPSLSVFLFAELISCQWLTCICFPCWVQ